MTNHQIGSLVFKIGTILGISLLGIGVTIAFYVLVQPDFWGTIK